MNSSENPDRIKSIHDWLTDIFGEPVTLISLAGDASLRRYFRLTLAGKRYVLMDSPPDYAPTATFIQVTHTLSQANVVVPEIIAADNDRGFLLLSDLGEIHYLDRLTEATAPALYHRAIDTLIKMQSAETTALPAYDRQRLDDETQLFEDWFLGRHLGIELDRTDRTAFSHLKDRLNAMALAQPTCFVHRDYHSRNLMVRENAEPGVLDYQDAVVGPITYDLVSLLRDVYIKWPDPFVSEMVDRFFGKVAAEQRVACSRQEFGIWFDWMGVQRHLKVAGIFCRLFYRDHKPNYLPDIPLTLRYLHEVAKRHDELSFLPALIDRFDLHERLAQANTRRIRS